MSDIWASGESYESYIGRWSRLAATQFLSWLSVPRDGFWLDVGCGTGALTQAILDCSDCRSVVGIDPSEAYVSYARARLTDERARFELWQSDDLPFEAASFHAVVSGLVLNFVTSASRALAEMKRVALPGGTVGAYVWDYADKMELLRYFWDAAIALEPAARDLDESIRFPLCNRDRLDQLFEEAGFREVEVRAIDVPTNFRDFNDYWSPFLKGQGPAPGYAGSLSEDKRTELRERTRRSLPIEPGGSIRLVARAWAVRGTVE